MCFMNRKKRGFSLPEVLIGTVIFAMIVGTAYFFLSSSMKKTRIVECEQMLKNEAESVMRTVMKDVSSLIAPPILDEGNADNFSYTLPILLKDETVVNVEYRAVREEKGTLRITRTFRDDTGRVAENVEEFIITFDPASFKIDVSVTTVGVPAGATDVRTHRLAQSAFMKQEVLASRAKFWVSHNRDGALATEGGITLAQDLESIAERFEENIEQIIAEGEASYRRAVTDLQGSLNELKNQSIPDLNKGLNKFYKQFSNSIFKPAERKARRYARDLGNRAKQTLKIDELKAIKAEAERKAGQSKRELKDLANAIEGKIKTIEAMGDVQKQIDGLKDKAREKGWK